MLGGWWPHTALIVQVFHAYPASRLTAPRRARGRTNGPVRLPTTRLVQPGAEEPQARTDSSAPLTALRPNLPQRHRRRTKAHARRPPDELAVAGCRSIHRMSREGDEPAGLRRAPASKADDVWRDRRLAGAADHRRGWEVVWPPPTRTAGSSSGRPRPQYNLRQKRAGGVPRNGRVLGPQGMWGVTAGTG